MKDDAMEEAPEECYSCHYRGASLTAYDRAAFSRDRSKMWLCHVCASTLAGNAYQYPEQYPHREAMALTAWGINYVADVAAGKVQR